MEIKNQEGIVPDLTLLARRRQGAFHPISRRETSLLAAMDTLEQRMKAAGIDEDDLDERFVLGSGSGGQKINKTASCVQLKHIPTGYEVSCQDSRSREKNREIARARMCEI